MRIVKDRAMVLTTTQPHLITERLKKHKIISEVDGVYTVALPWNMLEAQVLTTLKHDAPSPITRDYTWTGRFTPFAHQKETSAFLTLHKKAFCFNEQGTGKTASVIWAADYLMKIGQIKEC